MPDLNFTVAGFDLSRRQRMEDGWFAAQQDRGEQARSLPRVFPELRSRALPQEPERPRNVEWASAGWMVCPPPAQPLTPFGHRPWQQGIWKVDFPSPAPSHAGLFLFEVPHRHARRGGNSWVQPCVRCNPLKRLTRRRTSYPPQRPPGRRGPRGGFSLNREWRQPGQARDFANKVKNCDRRHR